MFFFFVLVVALKLRSFLRICVKKRYFITTKTSFRMSQLLQSFDKEIKYGVRSDHQSYCWELNLGNVIWSSQFNAAE